jgi:hypothetical protein
MELIILALALVCAPLLAEDIRVNLDRRDDPHAVPRLEDRGFAIHVEAAGYLQKLEPTNIHIETQQKGRWGDPRVDAGRYLKAQFDAEKPENIRIETTLKFDLSAGERRYSQERDVIQREAQKRAGGKEGAATKARTQLLLERIAAIREENIKAGADKRGKSTLHTPPLPRQALTFEKVDVLERLLKEQCAWQSVAEVFKATQFQPPDEHENPDFAASMLMAEEIRQAMMGNKLPPRYLSDSQYKALEQGSHYQFSARFIPEVSGVNVDTMWHGAPAVRLADGLVKRATLEGSLDRSRGQTVAWWRVESEAPNRLQLQLTKGDGDCFWTWVETPDSHVRYLRLLLHSPGTRYRMNLILSGASKGEEVTLYDGPVNAPTKAPF